MKFLSRNIFRFLVAIVAAGPLLCRAGTPVAVDGAFAHSVGAWHLDLTGGTKAEATTESAGASGPAIHIHVPEAGEKRYYVQLVGKGIALQEGRTYHLHFKARSQPPADLSVLAASVHEKFDELWRHDHVATVADWKDYDLDFQPKGSEQDGQIIFGGLAGQAGDYWFADVSLAEAK